MVRGRWLHSRQPEHPTGRRFLGKCARWRRCRHRSIGQAGHRVGLNGRSACLRHEITICRPALCGCGKQPAGYRALSRHRRGRMRASSAAREPRLSSYTQSIVQSTLASRERAQSILIERCPARDRSFRIGRRGCACPKDFNHLPYDFLVGPNAGGILVPA